MSFINRSIFRMLPVFLMGTAAYQSSVEKCEKVYCFALGMFMMMFGCIDILNDYFMFGAISAVIMVGMHGVNIPVGATVNKAAKVVAGYSFLIYIVHLSVFDVVEYYDLHSRYGDIPFLIISLGMVMIISIILHKFVEKPVINLEKKLIARLNPYR